MDCLAGGLGGLVPLLIAWFVTTASFAGDPTSPGVGDPPRSDEEAPSQAAWPNYTLACDRAWQLNPPNGERFDASALVRTADGRLWTLSDRGAVVYEIRFGPEGTGMADLVALTNLFTRAQLAGYAGAKRDRYDSEGLALDSEGRLYLAEEANRWILRYDPVEQSVTRLDIDWSPVKRGFDAVDRNASFEGVAVDPTRLYVANERQRGMILIVDLARLAVQDPWTPRPHGSRTEDVHYSDLSWSGGHLYALLRRHHVVLKLDPERRQVLGEYDYGSLQEGKFAYRTWLPTGWMEGLAVTEDTFWLVTDNNGLARVQHPKDSRPTLFRCRRPDAAGGSGGGKAR